MNAVNENTQSGLAQIGHFIAGKSVSSASGRFKEIFNPATGEITKQVGLAFVDEVSAVVLAAKQALPA